jgi:hypothetical protein
MPCHGFLSDLQDIVDKIDLVYYIRVAKRIKKSGLHW